MAEPADRGARPEPSFWRILQWMTVTGLPLGVVASMALTLFGRLALVPSYAEIGMRPGGFPGLALGWPWGLGCAAVPLGGLLLCYLSKRPVLRVVIALVVFHVWLALFVATAVGMGWPALTL